MLTPSRSVRRFALAAMFVAVGFSAGLARAAEPEATLPSNTVFFFKVGSVAKLKEAFGQTSFAQLIADPAMKPMKESVGEKISELSKKTKEAVGLSVGELLGLPQGAVTLAVVAKGEGKFPVAILISADAGKNQEKMSALMKKLNDAAEKEGKVKVSSESFKSLTLHVLKSEKEDDPSLAWTNSGSVFHISIASDASTLKDVISHADGRDDSLAKSENYGKLTKKLGDGAQIHWFLDVSQIIKLGVKAAQAAGGNQNPEAILQLLGINGLKALGGSMSFGLDKHDAVSKLVILAPSPVQGLMKMFSMPKRDLRPEAWVPGTVATYQSMSWDLDAAFNAVNDLLNTFQPGMLNGFEQNLVGPNGGEPLSFQKDIFGPLGNRITVLSDFKKPIKEDSQRMLFAISLDDAKKFQNTINKLIAIAGGEPKKREFQGTTIYDFTLPEIPNAGANNPFKGAISVAVAKDYAFVATAPELLESILRGGASSLGDSPAFQSVAKEIPSQTSSISFASPDEQARASYDMIKSGQLEQVIKQANPNGPDLSGMLKIFDKDKLPEFSVFQKYLSNAAGYGVMDDDGVVFTSFSVRKGKP